MTRRRSFELGSLLLLLVAGCGPLGDAGPETARLHLEGTAEAQVRLVVSTSFSVTGTPSGEPSDISIEEADTVVVTLPFEERYDISASQRFYARAARLLETDEISMRAWIDDQERYRRSLDTSAADSLLEFVYASQRPLSGGGNVP